MEWKSYVEGEDARRGLEAGLSLFQRKHTHFDDLEQARSWLRSQQK